MAGNSRPLIGVLALQGDVREHARVLTRLGALVREVRQVPDLVGVEGLVIPGGESGVIDKLSRLFGLHQPIRDLIAGGLPVLGTCAGLIMLASQVEDGIEGQQTFGGLDVDVRRNAFGAQVDSFDASIEIAGVAGPPVDVSFIRAPIVTRVGEGVQVIASLPDGRVVGVANAGCIGVSFHPEITGDDRLHQLFLHRVAQASPERLTLPS